MLEAVVVPPPLFGGMTVSFVLLPAPHWPTNRFATARTATEPTLQPPVTTLTAALEPPLQPPSPSSTTLMGGA